MLSLLILSMTIYSSIGSYDNFSALSSGCYYYVQPEARCQNSGSFFCFYGDKISNENFTRITTTLVLNSREHCDHDTPSVGIAMLANRSIDSVDANEEEHIKESGRIVRDQWVTLFGKNELDILLLVSCDDSYMYETYGPNISNVLESRCSHVLNMTEPIHNNSNNIDCFSKLIEPRIAVYRQIMDGTHSCYEKHNVYSIIVVYALWFVIAVTVASIVCKEQ